MTSTVLSDIAHQNISTNKIYLVVNYDIIKIEQQVGKLPVTINMKEQQLLFNKKIEKVFIIGMSMSKIWN